MTWSIPIVLVDASFLVSSFRSDTRSIDTFSLRTRLMFPLSGCFYKDDTFRSTISSLWPVSGTSAFSSEMSYLLLPSAALSTTMINI